MLSISVIMLIGSPGCQFAEAFGGLLRRARPGRLVSPTSVDQALAHYHECSTGLHLGPQCYLRLGFLASVGDLRSSDE